MMSFRSYYNTYFNIIIQHPNKSTLLLYVLATLSELSLSDEDSEKLPSYDAAVQSEGELFFVIMSLINLYSLLNL